MNSFDGVNYLSIGAQPQLLCIDDIREVAEVESGKVANVLGEEIDCVR